MERNSISPLQHFRQKASFSWNSFSVKFFGEVALNYQNEIWKVMQEEPIFKRVIGDATTAGI